MDPSQLANMDLSKVPAGVPPPGVIPNFQNPTSRSDMTIIFNSILTGLMLVFVVLRMHTRIFIFKKLQLDDYFCLLGACLSITYTVLNIWTFKNGIGPHQWDIPLSKFLDNTMIRVLQTIYDIYPFAIAFAKLSILCLYFRLFSIYRTLAILIHIGIWSTVLLYSTQLIVTWALCTKSTALEYVQCSPTLTTVALVTSGFNIASDFYILAIPVLAVWRLQMNMRKKIGVLTVFSTGLLACGAGVAGLAVRLLPQHGDISWWMSPIAMLTCLECNIGLIIGCMPILPKLFKHVRDESKLFSSWRGYMRSRRTGSSNSSEHKSGWPKSNDSPASGPRQDDSWTKIPSLEVVHMQVHSPV